MAGAESKFPLRFFDHLETIGAGLRSRRLVLFLDYDGTLTPIVATPDLAILGDSMRAQVQTLAQRMKVSIVSGRATDDVRHKVGLSGIFYAGSHGFEIVAPDGHVEIQPEAAAIRPLIDDVHAQLQEKLQDIPGALVEHVKYTISAHYRLVSEMDFPKIEAAVNQVLAVYPGLRCTHGKKVFEIRPRIDWDKGKAVNWILQVLKFDPQQDVAVYIGDDTTDEDAFVVLKDRGFGILVAETPRKTAAQYLIKNIDEVSEVLKYLTQDNI